MGYVTPEQITKTKEIDLLTYLRDCAPMSWYTLAGIPTAPVSMTA